jgi:hypothetical protein
VIALFGTPRSPLPAPRCRVIDAEQTSQIPGSGFFQNRDETRIQQLG